MTGSEIEWLAGTWSPGETRSRQEQPSPIPTHTPTETQDAVPGQGGGDAAKFPVGLVVGIVIGGVMIGAAAMWYGRKVSVRRSLDKSIDLEFRPEISTDPQELALVLPKPPI
jgi:hypothetical protein